LKLIKLTFPCSGNGSATLQITDNIHWIILGSQKVLTFLKIKLISCCVYFLIARAKTKIIIIIIITEDICIPFFF